MRSEHAYTGADVALQSQSVSFHRSVSCSRNYQGLGLGDQARLHGPSARAGETGRKRLWGESSAQKDRSVSQSVSQSLPTPSRELMAHTHTLLWYSFQVCGRYLCHLSSSYLFFWQGLHFRMMPMAMFFLPSAFTYESSCWRRSCSERTSVMNQSTRWKLRSNPPWRVIIPHIQYTYLH